MFYIKYAPDCIKLVSKCVRNHHRTNMSTANSIKTFIFFDCETTGLPQYENNTTRITELCLVAVQSSNIALGVYPRVMNKLNLCLNPGKFISPEATDMTGLNNFSLECQPFFNAHVAQTIQNFIDTNQKPVCIVSHNGFYFDFPILKAEISKAGNCLPDDILCMDSLGFFKSEYFQEISNTEFADKVNSQSFMQKITIKNEDSSEEVFYTEAIEEKPNVLEIQIKNETTPKRQKITLDQWPAGTSRHDTQNCTDSEGKNCVKNLSFGKPSFKLVDIYKRLTKREPFRSHEAEGDVLLLIHCAATSGERFVDWANKYSIPFKDIKPLTPGKKIGT